MILAPALPDAERGRRSHLSHARQAVHAAIPSRATLQQANRADEERNIMQDWNGETVPQFFGAGWQSELIDSDGYFLMVERQPTPTSGSAFPVRYAAACLARPTR